jgi:hypothetical protein
MRGISIRVDRLTRSIEDANTRERHKTEILRVLPEHVGEIKKPHFGFDWESEILIQGRQVHKLCRVGELQVIQGLVSLEDRLDHVYLHLIENAKSNRGKTKKYVGVAGNLFAFACKTSFENGYDGFIAFESKTQLVDHYMNIMGAKRLYGNSLYIDEQVASRLIIRYFGH